MKHSKKALLVSLSFLCIVALVSAGCIYINFKAASDCDVRKEMAGELDYLIVGASHGLRAFVPSVMDENLNCSSYNLSGGLMTFKGREAMLNEELARNNIKTVVFEISYNALSRPVNELEGDLYVVPRLSSFEKRMSYFFSNIDVFHWDLPYSYYFTSGIKAIPKMINNSSGKEKSVNKGYSPLKANDLTIKEEYVSAAHNSISNCTTINEENLEILKEMIASVREQGGEAIIVVTPISDSCIWQARDWDVFRKNLKEIGELYNIKTYDFNLLKDRYKLFNDKTSFYDSFHLSDEGAKTFTKEYCNLVKLAQAEDVDNLFYSNYEEMKKDSPYNR